MKILVTDADNRASLAVTRSLGRHGHEVYVANHRHPSLASSSRFCRQKVLVADPLKNPEAFARDAIAAVMANAIDAVIPASEVSTLTLARAAHDNPGSLSLCTPAYRDLDTAADKAAVLSLGMKLGVPVPKTAIVASKGDRLPELDFGFPVVIKPARSRVWSNGRWYVNSVSYANSDSELIATLQSLAPPQFPVLLQERLQGAGVGVFACYDHGRLLSLFSHRRLREKPPSGGVSVLRESVAVDPVAGQHARALLDSLNWHGVAMVEFKQDDRDGQLKLMEINGRLWGSLQLAIDAGVDFPSMMAEMLAGKTLPPVPNYRLGVQTRWLWGDIDSLLALFLQSRQALNLPSDHPGRWRTLLAFLLPWRPGLRYEVLSLTDPLPWLYESRRWFRPAAH